MSWRDGIVSLVSRVHQRLVFPRRTERLADALAELLPEGTRTLLDIGCGDGTIAAKLGQRRDELAVQGVDVLARPAAAIDVSVYDGSRLPFADDSFDAVMLIDVLHHCRTPDELLAEARRVARRTIIVKDHTAAGPVGRLVLRVMDWVGNRGHGVSLTYNYWSAQRWQQAWRSHDLVPVATRRKLGLYPFWARPLLEWRKHFLVRLDLPEAEGGLL